MKMSFDKFANDPAIRDFWSKQREKIDQLTNAEYRDLTKSQILPLARIKKIMKIEEDVRNQMISSEGPILIAKASEFLIEELTLRAWLHADSNRRKTLQKVDIGDATSQNDMFDFLIDIVPRPGQQESDAPVPILPRPAPGVSTIAVAGNASPNADVSIVNPSTGALTIDTQQIQYVLPVESDNNEAAQQPYIVNCDASAFNGAVTRIELANGGFVDAMPVGPSIPIVPGRPLQIVANNMHFVPLPENESQSS
ncbi:CBFD-NFYB-HMF domain-containing protein [Aphelenchoides besseyi]|nr:CBFD-NFYB-HMF domain-containing protein [Aphelenchoides besseyi]